MPTTFGGEPLKSGAPT
ncbi:hypothetical protein [Staphylococcus aureus]